MSAVPRPFTPGLFVDLTFLARKINENHDRAQGAGRQYLEAARAAGDALIAAKAQVGHGGWLDWLAANVKCKVRCAQNYMTVARHWQDIKNAQPAYLTDALALVDHFKPEPTVPGPTDPRQLGLFVPEELPIPPGATEPPVRMSPEASGFVKALLRLERLRFFDSDYTVREIVRGVGDKERAVLLEGLPRIGSWLRMLQEDIATERAP